MASMKFATALLALALLAGGTLCQAPVGYDQGKAGAALGKHLIGSDPTAVRDLSAAVLRAFPCLKISDEFLNRMTGPVVGSLLIAQQFSRACFNMLIPMLVFRVLELLHPGVEVTSDVFKDVHSFVMRVVKREQGGTLKVNSINVAAKNCCEGCGECEGGSRKRINDLWCAVLAAAAGRLPHAVSEGDWPDMVGWMKKCLEALGNSNVELGQSLCQAFHWALGQGCVRNASAYAAFAMVGSAGPEDEQSTWLCADLVIRSTTAGRINPLQFALSGAHVYQALMRYPTLLFEEKGSNLQRYIHGFVAKYGLGELAKSRRVVPGEKERLSYLAAQELQAPEQQQLQQLPGNFEEMSAEEAELLRKAERVWGRRVIASKKFTREQYEDLVASLSTDLTAAPVAEDVWGKMGGVASGVTLSMVQDELPKIMARLAEARFKGAARDRDERKRMREAGEIPEDVADAIEDAEAKRALNRRERRTKCECGRAQPTFGQPGGKAKDAQWCAQCPTKPADAVSAKRRCECGRAQPTFGQPGGTGKDAQWCAQCPTKPADAVNVTQRRCECGRTQPTFGQPGGTGKDAQWCAQCPTKPADAVNVTQRRCACGRAQPSLGQPGGKAKDAQWCAQCPTKPADAVSAKRRCECGRAQPTFGQPGGKAKDAQWCAQCPTKPEEAVSAKKRKK